MEFNMELRSMEMTFKSEHFWKKNENEKKIFFRNFQYKIKLNIYLYC